MHALPSPTWLLLFPFSQATATAPRLPQSVPLPAARAMVAEIQAGRWPFDPHERDLRTGRSLLHAIARHWALEDEVVDLYLQQLAKPHVSPEAWRDPAPEDGKDVLTFLRTERNWDWLKAFENAGFRNPQTPTADQARCASALRALREQQSVHVVPGLVQETLAAFGTSGAWHHGLPIGMWMLASHAQINGPDLLYNQLPGGSEKQAERKRRITALLENFATLAKQAQKHEPQGALAAWAWLGYAEALAQAKRWEEEPGVARVLAKGRERLGKPLDRYLAKAFPAVPPDDRYAALLERAILDITQSRSAHLRSWGFVPQASPLDDRARRALGRDQAVSALPLSLGASLWQALREREGMPEQALAALERVLWQAPARLLDPTQSERIQELHQLADVGERWRSATNYALGGIARRYRDLPQVPAHLGADPLVLALLLPAPGFPDPLTPTLTTWWAALPVDHPHWGMAHVLAEQANPAFTAHRREQALTETLPVASPPKEKIRL